MEPLFQNILVPTDFSESGNNVIKTAIELCRQHKAVLHLLHVAESRYVINAPEPGIALASMVNEIDQEARD